MPPQLSTSSAPCCTLCPFRPACRLACGNAASLVPRTVTLRAGDVLYIQGRAARAVYPIRAGGVKQVFETGIGWRQVSGFLQPGDVCGLEAHEADAHDATVIALQDSECCAIAVETLRPMLRDDPGIRAAVVAMQRRHARRQAELLVAIGSMKAAQRLAMLLLDLAAEQARRGVADGVLTLAMTRNDIASYLGLTLETVSRLLSRFGAAGLIIVRQRKLRIVDPDGLAAVHADGDAVAAPAPRVAAQAGPPAIP